MGYSEPDDMLVFCDRCNLAVHQGCYGVSKLPGGRVALLRVSTRSSALRDLLLRVSARGRRHASHGGRPLRPPHLRVLHAGAVAGPQLARGDRARRGEHCPRARAARLLHLREARRRLHPVQLPQLLHGVPSLLCAEGGLPADVRREERALHVLELLWPPQQAAGEEGEVGALHSREEAEAAEQEEAREEGGASAAAG